MTSISRARPRAARPWVLLPTLAAVLAVLTMACGRSDDAVQSYVQQRIAADPATASARLTVTVRNGVAHIKGETDTVAQQQHAVDIASAVKGVKQVQSEMRLSDAAMTDAVKQAIAADPAVSQVPVRVEVSNAEVTLSSDKTNDDERGKLKAAAASVPGVVHVVDNMK